jgi:hypothetical protein
MIAQNLDNIVHRKTGTVMVMLLRAILFLDKTRQAQRVCEPHLQTWNAAESRRLSSVGTKAYTNIYGR